MWAVNWTEAGCTEYANSLEDAHKIGQRGGIFYIITFLGEANDNSSESTVLRHSSKASNRRLV